MKRRVIIGALGALLAVSCAKIAEVEAPVPADAVKTIPYSITVGPKDTRAMVKEDLMTLRFAEGDKLYVASDSQDVWGVLDLKEGDAGKTKDATFEGTISFTGDEPSGDLPLNITLVGSNNKGVQISNDKVTGMVYPTYRDYCTEVFEAVEQYSLLTGNGTFGAPNDFSLGQHTSFLSFAVAVEGGNSEEKYSVYLKNDGNSYLLGEMSLDAMGEGNGVSFALPVPEGTVLKDASVHLLKAGGFSSQHASPKTYAATVVAPDADGKKLDPKVYRVTRTATEHTGLVDTGLPVVEIWTKGTDGQPVGVGTIDSDKSKEYHARVRIINANGEIIDPESDSDPEEDSDPETNCTIKGRGNSTWNWDKKPYKLKLEKKTSLLELGANSKHWVLLANCMDKTLMRNRVAMEISKRTGLAWTPNGTPVELYIDGVHRGNYLLIEQVRADEGLVNVTPEGATPENVNDAGFLLELDTHYDEDPKWKDLHGNTDENVDGNMNGIPFMISNYDEDKMTAEQIQYIKNYVFAAGGTLFSKNNSWNQYYTKPTPNNDPETGYPKYLDVESFIDYWIVFELMINRELRHPKSVYMYKPVGGKLTAGPCWDFDWGTLSYHYTTDAKDKLVNTEAIWYKSLATDSYFVKQVYDRFMDLKPLLEQIPGEIDKMEREMAVSAELNFQMWNPASTGGGDDGYNGDVRLSYHDAVARIKEIYTYRLGVMERELKKAAGQ